MKLAILLPVLAWLLVFLEAGITVSWLGAADIWMHNYMAFAAILTFISAFIYMKRIKDLSWIEEGLAFGVVFLLVNIFLDYAIIFLVLGTTVFNIQNLVLYVTQFLLCLLASFVVKKKYSQSFSL